MSCVRATASPALAVLSAITMGLTSTPGRAEVTGQETVQCQALAKVDFSQIQDAPTQIIETRHFDAIEGKPAHCQISGYVTPNVGFVLRLPEEHWNGKLAQVACGAFCGSTNDQWYAFTCNNPLRKGYACVVSDNGHKSHPWDSLWSYHNLQGEFDHAYRAPHVTALATKAIVQHYYGQFPQKSYFMGCSNGGRQGLMLAQRFPWDFDGIVAGAPEVRPPQHFMSLLWANRALTDTAGEPILGKPELEVLHRAVVAKCDLNDGVKDGLIGDPRACSFDPSTLLCSSGQTECLTRAQLDAVKKIYQGPVTSAGHPIYLPVALLGSEGGWEGYLGSESYSNRILREYFRYSAFDPNAGPNWKPQDFDFDRDSRRQGLALALQGTDNPDLRAFKAAGGKLLAYSGWSDIYVTPLSTVDYYETVERTVGGRKETQEFFRLFMMPGLNHCLGGDGAFAVDYLSYLESWAEKGEAPNEMMSFHIEVDDAELKHRTQFPLDPTTIRFSRPVYPYPIGTKYRGHGDVKDAASFAPVRP